MSLIDVDFLEIPAIFTNDELGNFEEIQTMLKCNSALHKSIVPAIEKDLAGDDSSVILLDDFFDEIEFYGVDPDTYIKFVSDQIDVLCRGI